MPNPKELLSEELLNIAKTKSKKDAPFAPASGFFCNVDQIDPFDADYGHLTLNDAETFKAYSLDELCDLGYLMMKNSLCNIKSLQFHDIFPERIADGLVWDYRYGGHTEVKWSVLYHSLLVEALVAPEYKLSALLHDASEAYLNDLTSAVKRGCKGYQKQEAYVQGAIHERFRLPKDIPPVVKEADRQAMLLEMSYLFPRVNMEKPDLCTSIMYDELLLQDSLPSLMINGGFDVESKWKAIYIRKLNVWDKVSTDTVPI